MVLTEYEKSVLTELLSGVPGNDLILIAKTVSQKLIDVKSPSRAVEIILLHSQTVESVLHRKKISKQLLFNYLNYKKIPVQPHQSKDDIIQSLMEYWKSNSYNSNIEWNQQSPNTSQETAYDQNYRQIEPGDQHHQVENYTTSQLHQNHTANQPSQDSYFPHQTSSLVPQSQDIVPQQSAVQNQLDVSSIDIQALGYEFTKWFNDRFNQCSYSNSYQFDSVMFFHNASAEFKLIRSNNGEERTENLVQVESNTQIGDSIVELQKTYNLYLNTNYESLKVSKNSYGNIIIGICGSLHSNSQLVGIYEQLFQLFNDPMCPSDKPVWKIQKMLLNLKFVSNYREIEASSQESQHSGMYEIEYNSSNVALR